MEEAIFTYVPMLVMPFYGDQLKNARIVENKRIGKLVNHKPVLIKEELKTAISEIVNNPKYKENIKKLAQFIKDVPMTGLETSVWWTEYVIRNKGAKQLKNLAADLPLYQYYLLDVVGFLIFTAVLLITVLTLFIRKIVRYLKRSQVTSRYNDKEKKHQ
ncbi:hypothetical protein NQ318_017202 [Aromia moschata]|uniref:Glucuronosyltransferase n=1 Tax=Aromia moschata TaxID=1265417 RepID=A0AAV8YLA7_9CUCU|nr:hypothetical protein NQ318_017202 [Aromia moschata]